MSLFFRISLAIAAMICGVAVRVQGQVSAGTADTSSVALAGRPRVVAPGIVSTSMAEFGGARTPDGATMVYTVTDRVFSRMTIVQTRRGASGWQIPEVASFSGEWNDADAALAPNGDALIFMSNRPMPGDSADRPRHDFNLWRVERQGTKWGRPEPLPDVINSPLSEVAPSLTTSGTLYFGRGGHIFRAERSGDGYAAPEALPFIGGNPSVSPDERMLIFVGPGRRQGDADLYLACRSATGWSVPHRLAAPVNSFSIEGDSVILPDGRTLVFASERGADEPVNWPRTRKAAYGDLELEARSNIFNGLRNLYEVGIPPNVCA